MIIYIMCAPLVILLSFALVYCFSLTVPGYWFSSLVSFLRSALSIYVVIIICNLKSNIMV